MKNIFYFFFISFSLSLYAPWWDRYTTERKEAQRKEAERRQYCQSEAFKQFLRDRHRERKESKEGLWRREMEIVQTVFFALRECDQLGALPEGVKKTGSKYRLDERIYGKDSE